MDAFNKSNTPKEIKDSLETPPYIVRWVKDKFGIDWDTACTMENSVAPPVWTPFEPFTDRNSLLIDWHGNCFCNPPYSNTKKWINFALKQKNATTLMLIPSPNGESYYKDLVDNSFEIMITGRLAFISPADFIVKGKNGNPDKHIKKGQELTGNNRGSSLFIINGSMEIGGRTSVLRDELRGTYM